MLKMTPNFALIDPPPLKIMGGVGQISVLLLKLYLRPNLRNTFDGRPLRAAERGGLIKKEKKKVDG